MKVLKHHVIDPKTGEVKEETYRQILPRAVRNKDFGMLGDSGITVILAKKTPPGALRVLLALCLHCQWSNRVQVTRTELCELAHVNKSSLWAALKWLGENDFVRSDANDKTRFEVSPEFFWRGKADDRPHAVRLWLMPDSTTCGAPQGTLT